MAETLTQPTLFKTHPSFDGATFKAARDADRLVCQLAAVQSLMVVGQWRTLTDIAMQCDYPVASIPGISARLRDLRKTKFGAHNITRRYLHDGIWEYRMESA